MKSAPTVVPVPLNDGTYRDVVFYKGANDKVWWFWDDGSLHHGDIGLTLP